MTCVAEAASFAPVRPLWESLLRKAPWRSIFLTPEWQETWWDEFGADGELRLIAVGPPDAPLGLAPLRLRDGALSFLGDTDLFDYHDFIAADPAFHPALFDCLEREDWRTMTLDSVPEGSPTLRLLPEAARARGCAVEIEDEDVAPGVALPPTWDDYLASLRKKDRHELRRKLRRLESAGEVRVRLATPDSIERDLALFNDVMAESREEKRDFLSPERESFFRGIARRMQSAGYLRLFLLEMDGDPAAAVLAFDYDDKRLLYNSGYRQKYTDLAAGLMLKALCVKDAIEQGLTYFDLLRGGEPYKHRLGAADARVRRIRVAR